MATHIMDSFRDIFIGIGYGWEIPYSGLLWFVYESNPLYISREQTYVPFFTKVLHNTFIQLPRHTILLDPMRNHHQKPNALRSRMVKF